MKYISLNLDARFKNFNWKEKENARLPNTYGARLYVCIGWQLAHKSDTPHRKFFVIKIDTSLSYTFSMECLTRKKFMEGVSDFCATLYMVCHPVITLHLISFLPLSYKYHDYHHSPLTSYYSTRYHNTSPLTHHHINTMTTSRSPADDVT